MAGAATQRASGGEVRGTQVLGRDGGKVSRWRVLSRSVMCSDILTRSMLIRE